MTIESYIKKQLQDVFNPVQLTVINESHKHKGHAGDDGTGQTHFKVEIEAEQLKSMSRVDAQRSVYTALDDAFTQGLHALSLKVIR